jgi:hypothetical protein
MLLLTRGLDLLQESFKNHPNEAWGARMRVALGDVFTADAWLARSWFLLVPLAINAFFLCPLVFHRANSARAGGATTESGRIRASLIMSSSLLAATLVYFAAVYLHKEPEKADTKPAVAHVIQLQHSISPG